MNQLPKDLAEQRALVAEQRLEEAEGRALEAEERAARAELEVEAVRQQLTALRGGVLRQGWWKLKSLFCRYVLDRNSASTAQKKKP